MDGRLLCTFVKDREISDIVKFLQENFQIASNKIFVLQNEDTREFLLTYSVVVNSTTKIPINTIAVHRKKESNTLYTINGLNELIKKLNNGTLDKYFSINWADYQNTLLLTKGPELKKIHTKLYSIIDSQL